ncbi:MAG: hypothetical protein LH471_04535, partial [Salinibacterium sp.]|nr:hypothetical protein [Salinibacterium sp.]
MSSDPMSRERDPALVPGPTAAQWDLFAKLALAGSVVAIAVGIVAVAVGVPPTIEFAIAVLVVVVAMFCVWLGLSQRALVTLRAEQRAGYSTVLDAAGYALRHPVTGALERAEDELPADTNRTRRSLVAGMFRV